MPKKDKKDKTPIEVNVETNYSVENIPKIILLKNMIPILVWICQILIRLL